MTGSSRRKRIAAQSRLLLPMSRKPLARAIDRKMVEMRTDTAALRMAGSGTSQAGDRAPVILGASLSATLLAVPGDVHQDVFAGARRPATPHRTSSRAARKHDTTLRYVTNLPRRALAVQPAQRRCIDFTEFNFFIILLSSSSYFDDRLPESAFRFYTARRHCLKRLYPASFNAYNTLCNNTFAFDS
jgi:hypothetical protein